MVADYIKKLQSFEVYTSDIVLLEVLVFKPRWQKYLLILTNTSFVANLLRAIYTINAMLLSIFVA
jgi:hypothetical protein